MTEKLLDYFSKFIPLSAEERNAIAEDMEIQKFEKGMSLLKEGQFSEITYFVLQGCVRQFYVIDGEEKTANFFTEEQWIISTSSPLEKKPAAYNLRCTEDCYLVIGDSERGDRLLARFPKFQELSRMILEKEIAKQQKMMSSFITDSPEQRYLKLQETRPDLLERVPQYQLASFIGVKPESLSRIRNRISKRK